MTISHYKTAIALHRAVEGAGFTTGAIKQLETRRGVAWNVQLKCNGKAVALAFNDGVGGMSRLDPVVSKRTAAPNTAAAKALMLECMDKLFALPEVQAHLQAQEVECLPAKVFRFEEEPAADLIATLADHKKTIAKLKLVASKKLAWAEANHELGSYVSVQGADTPALRSQVMARYPKDFEGFQGFLGDLLQGL
jgi:hypothetical protein